MAARFQYDGVDVRMAEEFQCGGKAGRSGAYDEGRPLVFAWVAACVIEIP